MECLKIIIAGKILSLHMSFTKMIIKAISISGFVSTKTYVDFTETIGESGTFWLYASGNYKLFIKRWKYYFYQNRKSAKLTKQIRKIFEDWREWNILAKLY